MLLLDEGDKSMTNEIVKKCYNLATAGHITSFSFTSFNNFLTNNASEK